MKTLSQARDALSLELQRGYIEGDGCLPEADTDINNASRRVIEAMAEENGEAWLGKFNLHGDERHGAVPVIWKWDGGLVYNFGCDFVAPKFDEALEKLLRERDDAEYTTTAADVVRLRAIFERIAAIGGISLIWT
jgi:hypothetical protein